MIGHFKNVHDMLVEAFAKYYNGEDVDFHRVCLNCKDTLESNRLMGQNIGDYPPEYYRFFQEFIPNREERGDDMEPTI